jgi:mutator protein MutT
MKVACGIMYDNSGKILMGLRSKYGANPHYWEFPGGKCEKDETLEECLHREWKEELNLDIEIHKLLYTTQQDWIECYFYTGKIKDMSNLQVKVHEYVGFYDVNDLHKLRLFSGDEVIVDLLKN